MILYVLRRLTAGLVLAVLVTMITFLLLSTSFDDIAGSILGSSATPARIEQQKAQLGLDRPVLVQYLDWLSHAVRGDFGLSYFTSEPVRSAIAARLGVTLSVVLAALLLTAVVGVTLGVLAATRAGVVDRIAQGASLFGHLVPNLLIAIGLVWLLALRLHWFPATGYTPLGEDPTRWGRIPPAGRPRSPSPF